MSTKEVDVLAFDTFDTTVNLSDIPEEDKWFPNEVLVIENIQPELIFPFIPSFKSAEAENIPQPVLEL